VTDVQTHPRYPAWWPIAARDPDEPHRAATPLELLFDLCFVVAVAQGAASLHHGLAAGEVGHSVFGYLGVFFAIWWAWMNFTWFASAYDTDDVAYRLLTFVQIAGVLVLASGVTAAFDGDFFVVTIGYVIIRVSSTIQWFRAAAGDPVHRQNALRFAWVLIVTQLGWVGRLFLPDSLLRPSFVVLVVVELAGAYFAEHTGSQTTWHPGHIAERYGLFTIIVLGECILSSFVAVDAAITDTGVSVELCVIAGAGLVIVFGLWWTYFCLEPDEMLRERPNLAFVWGYGHYFVFASIAALGAGIAVAADYTAALEHAVDDHHISELLAAFSVAVPVAVALAALAWLRWLAHESGPVATTVSFAAAAMALVPAALANAIGVPAALVVIGAVVTVNVVVHEASTDE